METDNPRHALSEEDVEKLLAEVHKDARPFVTLAVDTGMRRGELYDLQWEDVDLAQQTILVRDRKRNAYTLLSMTERVRVLLEEMDRQQKKERLKSLFVLPRNADGKPINRRTTITKAAARAGLPHVSPHTLRHTFATLTLDAGAELYDVQAALGHKTSVMTQRYDHGRSEQAKRVTEALERSREQA